MPNLYKCAKLTREQQEGGRRESVLSETRCPPGQLKVFQFIGPFWGAGGVEELKDDYGIIPVVSYKENMVATTPEAC